MISRIYGLTLRYLFVYKRSFIRFGELLVFPLLDLLLWGFFASYIKQHAPVGYLLGALILWDVFYRANQAASLSILQEMWVGNTINLFVTPIRSIEIIISTSLFGIIRASIIFIFLSFCAYYLYSFNFFSLLSKINTMNYLQMPYCNASDFSIPKWIEFRKLLL